MFHVTAMPNLSQSNLQNHQASSSSSQLQQKEQSHLLEETESCNLKGFLWNNISLQKVSIYNSKQLNIVLDRRNNNHLRIKIYSIKILMKQLKASSKTKFKKNKLKSMLEQKFRVLKELLLRYQILKPYKISLKSC